MEDDKLFDPVNGNGFSKSPRIVEWTNTSLRWKMSISYRDDDDNFRRTGCDC